MGLDATGWLALSAAVLAVVGSAVQARYWWTSSSREAAAAAAVRAAAVTAKKDLEEAAEVARRIAQTTARKDALAEWQKLYEEKDRVVGCLQEQNDDQQRQINDIRVKHDDCEKRYAILAQKVEKVEKIANGTEKGK